MALTEERFLAGNASELPWVIEKRGFHRKYQPEMVDSVLAYMKTLPKQGESPLTKANAIGWLNKCYDPKIRESRISDAFAIWESLQEKQEQQAQQTPIAALPDDDIETMRRKAIEAARGHR